MTRTVLPIQKKIPSSEENSGTMLLQTPSQTVGPYFAYGLTPGQYGYDFKSICGSTLVNDRTDGEIILLTGRVLDGNGTPITDAMIEIWQADSVGNYATEASKAVFHGFGRCGTGTDVENRFVFQTIKPGSVGGQAPHINVIVFMRGLLSHAYTRLYFSDEAQANAQDEVLDSVPPERRATLIARREVVKGQIRYVFDIRMQAGEEETVFFDV